MKRVYFDKYKDKNIYVIDYSGLEKDEDFFKVLDTAKEFREKNFEKFKPNSQLLFINLTEAFIVGKVFGRMKESGKDLEPYIKKEAIIGISGSKKILLNLYNKIIGGNLKAFENKEKALEWLVS